MSDISTCVLSVTTAKAKLHQLSQQLLARVNSAEQPLDWDQLKEESRLLYTVDGQSYRRCLYHELHETMKPIRIVKRGGTGSLLMPCVRASRNSSGITYVYFVLPKQLLPP